jgi:hypothetical protein
MLTSVIVPGPTWMRSEQQKKRTVVAIISASIISIVVWSLVVILNVH